ncbi:hypothetical protein O181_095950 [Austropuccinia psidii MF-1]|uniref:Uncharacterized protein n=1 Tax=Austropuccinia psidii MF-1 TaxID=1389203 RepID=A0A9Q3PCJ8_9BASI|nr:hypothetical protein [Austropuccinia psidii MF-1]
MIHIQEQKSPWEVFQMGLVTALPPSCDRGYNACIVIVNRYRKTPIFLPCHKDETAMDTALILCKFKDSAGFTHDWCTLITALEFAYKTSVYSSTGKTAAILEKGWNPILPADTLRKDLIEIHPTASSFKEMLDKVKHHAKQSINDSFDYAKQKWDKSHKVADFKEGELVLVSTFNFNNRKGTKKLKDSYVGAFVIFAIHRTNVFQVELSGDVSL